MKKLLILGGSPFQIPAIKYARDAGYHVITCDYLPQNPGHKLAHEYHNASTTDLDAVLDLSVRLRIDGVLAYASDPAAPTAAYVAHELGLPGNPYESVCMMAQKDRYRRFLIEHGFHAPRAVSWSGTNGAQINLDGLRFPVMVKPVDSSGSKGVSKVADTDGIAWALEEAMRFSRCKRAVVEEYIVRQGPQIGGEAFVRDGDVVCMCLGDQMVDSECNPYVPTGMTFPSRVSPGLARQIREELQRFLQTVEYSGGGLNLEIMLDHHDRVHLMEVGPRTGGNYLPELVRYGTGFDIAGCSVEIALGHPISERLTNAPAGSQPSAFAYYAVHARTRGVLRGVEIDPSLTPNIVEQTFFKQNGELVEPYNGSNCTIGILLLTFDSQAEMERKMAAIQDLARPVVESALS